MSGPGFIYSEAFLRHDTGAHPENGDRLKAILEDLQRNTIDCQRLQPAPATEEQLAWIHEPGYIRMVQRACREGRRRLDADTAICPESYGAALLAAGAAITAVNEAVDNRAKRTFCAVRPPGHHAERDRAMGFCLFNNIAIGAQYAIQARGLKKVFILDWDVHHGNGTQQAFYDRGDVYYASIHQWPHYPGTGPADETGAGAGLGFNRNFPVSAFEGDETYCSILEESILPEMVRFAPDLIMISAGFDAHQSDFLASMHVSTEGFGRMTEKVVETADKVCGGRIVSILEGGYHLRALGESVSLHLSRLAGA